MTRTEAPPGTQADAALAARNPVGWGFTAEAAGDAERKRLYRAVGALLGPPSAPPEPPPAPEDVALPAPRVEPPAALSGVVTSAHRHRLLFGAGRAFRDLAALRSGRLDPAPDAVAHPRSEAELLEVLAWANARGVAVIPFGGGSSVTGGVAPRVPARFDAVVTLDLAGLAAVLDVDPVARVVRAQAGIFGPALDAALAPHGLAARHFPQSYHHSTLGGWVATRSAGHYSTLLGKIEDRVQALRVVTGDGRVADTRPLPGGSVGPDPVRLWAGSEGALGVLTEVALRVVARPVHRRVVGATFRSFEAGLAASRAIVQAGLWPAQLRLLDPFEQMVSAAISGAKVAPGAYLIVGFESADEPVDAAMAAALRRIEAAGGKPEAPRDPDSERDPEGGVEGWRRSFFRGPYLRDALIDAHVIAETFETAVPWNRAEEAYQHVRDATLRAAQRECGAAGVLCRTTHAYPDGVSLYFSVFARGRKGALVAQWDAIKADACRAVLDAGGTLSHHHAMGRDHHPHTEVELPAPWRAAVAAAKRSLDPQGVLNPGLWPGGDG